MERFTQTLINLIKIYSDTKNLNVKGIISMINITRYLQTLLLYALWGVITLIII